MDQPKTPKFNLLFNIGPWVALIWSLGTLPGILYLTALEGCGALIFIGLLALSFFSYRLIRSKNSAQTNTSTTSNISLLAVLLFLLAMGWVVPVFQTFGRTLQSSVTTLELLLPWNGSIDAAPLDAAKSSLWYYLCIFPAICIVVLEILDRVSPPDKEEDSKDESGAANQNKLETFLLNRRYRRDLAFGFFLIGIGFSFLHGKGAFGIKSTLAEGALLALFVLSIRPLLRLTTRASESDDKPKLPWGVKVVLIGTFISAASAATWTGYRYSQMWNWVEKGSNALIKNDEQTAQKSFKRVEHLNTVLLAKSPDLAAENSKAKWLENRGEVQKALHSWMRVARLNKVPELESLHVIRVYAVMGDSIPFWRKFVYDGWEILENPDLHQGLKALGNTPHPHLRGRLSAALFEWYQQKGQQSEQLAKLLKDTQRLFPGEISSGILLHWLEKKPVPVGTEFYLNKELLLAKEPSLSSLLGSLNESKTMSTRIILDKGTWEVEMEARGTPLDDRWPRVRLQVGPYSSSEQIRTTKRNITPFQRMVVSREGLYLVTITFANKEEQFLKGHMKRRSLELFGVRFRKEKN